MYHPPRGYTMEGISGSYGWLVENMDTADCQNMTDADIYAWIDCAIAFSKENAIAKLEANIEDMTFPRLGYTIDQKFQDADEYEAFKRAQIDSDLGQERERVFDFLKSWIG